MRKAETRTTNTTTRTSNPPSTTTAAMTKARTAMTTSPRTLPTAPVNRSGASPTMTVCLVSCHTFHEYCRTDLYLSLPECVADYGEPPKEWKPSEPMPPPAEGTGVVHTVMVAPMQGVLRYWPFALNASVGDTIRYVWTTPANHTATLSSALAPCNRSARAEELKWASGVRNATAGTQTCAYPSYGAFA
jgi:plastocyanin